MENRAREARPTEGGAFERIGAKGWPGFRFELKLKPLSRQPDFRTGPDSSF